MGIKRLKFLLLSLVLVVMESLISQVIVIDAGHGWQQALSSGGCVSGDSRCAIEHNTAHGTSIKTKNVIESSCQNWQVNLTRPSNACNGWVSLSQRTTMANNWNADVFLSIHTNAIGSSCSGQSATGTETFYCTQSSSSDAQAANLCQLVQNNMVSYGNWFSRRAVEDNSYLNFHLYVLRNTNAPGVLNEVGFGDNNSDAAKLNSDSWRDQFAQSYFESIQTFLGISCTNPIPSDSGSCLQPIPISCGQIIDGNTIYGQSNINTYGCGSQTEFGRELIFQFDITNYSNVTASLDNLSVDLDIHLLSACNADSCIARNDNTVTASNLAPGTYYIAVDGFGTSQNLTGSFQLSLSCSNSTPLSGSCNNPILINCGDIVNSSTVIGQSINDFYGCNQTPQNGREVYYKFNLAQDGVVDIDLSNLTSNIDVHLLSDCDIDSCISYGDNRISGLSLAQGDYFIVLDGAGTIDDAYGSFTMAFDCAYANPTPSNEGTCISPTLINCDTSIIGNTASGGKSFGGHSCNVDKYKGYDYVYYFVNQEVSDFNAVISNFSQDLDIFLLQACDNQSCLAYGDNAISYSNLSQGLYYLVIDGKGEDTTMVSSYSLSISCNNVVSGLNEESLIEGRDFKYYPTFIEQQITIEFSQLIQTKLTIEFYSLSGQLVAQEIVESSQKQNVIQINEDLTSGIYVFQIKEMPSIRGKVFKR